MAIQIKSAGAKPATRKTSTTKAKPAARTRKAPTKATAKKTTTARKAAPKATAAPTRQRRSSKTDLTQAQLNKILKPLARDAVKRTSFHDQWKEYVAKVNEQIISALDEGVPVSLIVEHGDISRQHVYKLLEDAKKSTNGRKPAAKTTAAKRSPGRPKGSTNNPKPATRKTTTASKTKPKIRARS